MSKIIHIEFPGSSETDAKNLNVRISHIYREGNCAADKLASMSTDEYLDTWWFHAPETIQRLIYRDIVPLPFCRFRNLQL